MSRRPNVLFMISDDHRYSAVGSLDEPVRTPTMDAMIERGTLFRRTQIMGSLSGAVCICSRTCLHTGANLFRATTSSVIDDGPGLRTLRPELPLLAETFRRAGYRTHAVGKWHNDPASFNRGFAGGSRLFFSGMSDHDRVPLHEYDPSGVYPKSGSYLGDGFSTEIFARAAMQFLRDQDGAEPFFCYLAFTSPHDPRTPPERFAQLYPPADVPLPANFLPEHPFDNGELDIRDENLAPFPRTPEAIRQHLADYYGMISHQDHWMGLVLDTLADTGHLDDTIVVYLADHGLAVGQHGLMGKQNLYEHSIRVPFLLTGPGVPESRRVEQPVAQYDVYPTLCELAEVPIPETVESRSLVPLLTTDAPQREFVCSLYKDVQRGISDGRWKLIRYYRTERGGGRGEDRLQLFDLESDPAETQDLAHRPEHRERLTRLAAALERWMREVRDPLAGEEVLP